MDTIPSTEPPEPGQSVVKSLADALAKAQGEFQPPKRNCKVDYTYQGQRVKYSYADLAGIMAAVVPALSKHGLAITHQMQYDEILGAVLVTTLWHGSGESLNTRYPLPDPATQKPQQFGSAITYAKRYSVCGLLAIAAEDDDDGAAAEAPVKTQAPPGQPPKQSSAPAGDVVPREVREIRERNEATGYAGVNSTINKKGFDQSQAEEPNELDKALGNKPSQEEMNKPQADDPMDYKIPFGQFLGKTIRQVGLTKAEQYLAHVESEAEKNGREIKGLVLEFQSAVRAAGAKK